MTDNYYNINETLTEILYKINQTYNTETDRINKCRVQGELFNVFDIVGLKVEEVRLHSALLAELLYPKGHHGVSSLFLKAFLLKIF